MDATLLAAGLPEAPDLSGAIDATGLRPLDWALAAAILVAGILLGWLLRRLLALVLRRTTFRESVADRVVGRILHAITALVALVYALDVLGVRIGPLLGALGIGGIALALALQPTIQNLFSGLVLHAQRPLRIGDEIVTGEFQGRVVDITSRAVVVLTNSGETVTIPNSVVIDREIVNLVRHGTRRSIVTVGVAYDTDLARARDVLLAAVVGPDGVLHEPAPQVFAGDFADSSVQLDVLVWHAPGDAQRRAVRGTVVEAVHRALGEAGITIPFPQRTIWQGDA